MYFKKIVSIFLLVFLLSNTAYANTNSLNENTSTEISNELGITVLLNDLAIQNKNTFYTETIKLDRNSIKQLQSKKRLNDNGSITIDKSILGENSLIGNESFEFEIYPETVKAEIAKETKENRTLTFANSTITIKYIGENAQYLNVEEVKKIKSGLTSVNDNNLVTTLSSETSPATYMYSSITVHEGTDGKGKKRAYLYGLHKWDDPGKGINQQLVDFQKDVVYNAWGVGPTTQSDSSRSITATYISTWDWETKITRTKSQLNVHTGANGPNQHGYEIYEVIQPNTITYALDKVELTNYTSWFTAGSIGEDAGAETGYVHSYKDFSMNVGVSVGAPASISISVTPNTTTKYEFNEAFTTYSTD